MIRIVNAYAIFLIHELDEMQSTFARRNDERCFTGHVLYVKVESKLDIEIVEELFGAVFCTDVSNRIPIRCQFCFSLDVELFCDVFSH